MTGVTVSRQPCTAQILTHIPRPDDRLMFARFQYNILLAPPINTYMWVTQKCKDCSGSGKGFTNTHWRSSFNAEPYLQPRARMSGAMPDNIDSPAPSTGHLPGSGAQLRCRASRGGCTYHLAPPTYPPKPACPQAQHHTAWPAIPVTHTHTHT